MFPVLRVLRDSETARLMGLGVLVGALGGLAAGAFDALSVGFSSVFLGTGDPSVVAPGWIAIALVPVLGGLFAGVVVRFGTRDGRPQGIADVLEGAVHGVEHVSLRNAVATAVSAAAAIGSGHSGGREGPVVQLSGAVASRACRSLGVSPARARVLVAAGAAAGIAASFNTPLGGAFFALEILLGNFALDMFGPVVAATVTGTVVGQALLGQRVALQLPSFGLVHPVELVAYLVLGAICGLLAVGFGRALTATRTAFEHLSIPSWLHPALAGLAVTLGSVVGLHAIMGNGYGFLRELLSGEDLPAIGFLLVLLVAKLAASLVMAGGRGSPGLFAPMLFVGAVTGTLFGASLEAVWPSAVGSPAAYGVVGMGAFVAATTHAPITMTLMLFELTGNYQIILAMMIALAVAGVVSRAMRSESIYVSVLHDRGVSVDRSREDLVMYDLRVRDILVRSYEKVAPDASFRDLAQRFLQPRIDRVFVVDEAGVYQGVVELTDVKSILVQPDTTALVRDAPVRLVPALLPDQPIADALALFYRTEIEELPVVDAQGQMIGVLPERLMLGAYHREVLRRQAVLAHVEHLTPDDRSALLELPEGEIVRTVRITGTLTGKSLRGLSLSERYGVTVVAMNLLDAETGTRRRVHAEPDTVLHEGDELVVLGPADQVADLAEDTFDRESTVEVAKARTQGPPVDDPPTTPS